MTWKALTIRPPWSWAVAHGGKHTENRTGGPGHWSYRGPLLIHAGLGWSERGQHDQRVLDAWRNAYPLSVSPGIAEAAVRGLATILRPGEFVAVAELADAHPAMGCCAPWGEDQYVDSAGRLRTDLIHLVLEDVRPVLTSVRVRGRLGLWTPGPEAVAAVETALGEMR